MLPGPQAGPSCSAQSAVLLELPAWLPQPSAAPPAALPQPAGQSQLAVDGEPGLLHALDALLLPFAAPENHPQAEKNFNSALQHAREPWH